MNQKNVYVKCDRNIETPNRDVFLADLGELRCGDSLLAAKLKAIKVYRFAEDGPQRAVISSLRLVELMEEVCPEISVQIVGEPDVLIEHILVPQKKGVPVILRVIFVCLVSFFGTGFTIMAYHNDVGISYVFEAVYELIMGRKAVGINPLEVSYSVGLAAGILVFFNHIGRRNLTKDPTPIEVSIRNYEEDVDRTLIAMAGREGLEQENGTKN